MFVMKHLFCVLGILTLAIFVFGPISVSAQTVDTAEQARIQELQAIVVQLLRLVAELQQRLLVVQQQAQMPAVLACGQAKITWTGVSGATDYVLYRNGVEVYNGKNLEFLDKGLMPGVTYAYTVRAKNAGGLGPVSPVQTITIPPQCPPAIPNIWTQEGTVCGGTVQVFWGRVQGADFYEVFRGNARVFSGNTTSYIDRGLVSGNSYAYKVRAGNSGGLGQFSQETSVKASVVCPPAAPKVPTVKDPVSDSVAREGMFDIAIHGVPSGATAQSGGGEVDILGFLVSAKRSPIVIGRVDVEFSDRPWLFLSSVEIRDGGRTLSKIEVVQDSFVKVGDSAYRLRFSNFALEIPEGGSKTVTVRVVAQANLLLVQPRALIVSIPTNGVFGKDEAGVTHEGPNEQKAPAFTKTFFVKRP